MSTCVKSERNKAPAMTLGVGSIAVRSTRSLVSPRICHPCPQGSPVQSVTSPRDDGTIEVRLLRAAAGAQRSIHLAPLKCTAIAS
jgi:hypothetical protein